MSQKQDRAIKFINEVKTALTHKLPERARSEFAVKVGHYQAEFREHPESDYPDIQGRFDHWVKSLLGNVPEATSDAVRASLHQLDLAINGRHR